MNNYYFILVCITGLIALTDIAQKPELGVLFLITGVAILAQLMEITEKIGAE